MKFIALTAILALFAQANSVLSPPTPQGPQ